MDSEEVMDKDFTYEYCYEDADTILIDLVKNFPYLYDKSTENFKNIHKKDRAWMEISSVLKLSGNFY